jgi:hypothetical protein
VRANLALREIRSVALLNPEVSIASHPQPLFLQGIGAYIPLHTFVLTYLTTP